MGVLQIFGIGGRERSVVVVKPKDVIIPDWDNPTEDMKRSLIASLEKQLIQAQHDYERNEALRIINEQRGKNRPLLP